MYEFNGSTQTNQAFIKLLDLLASTTLKQHQNGYIIFTADDRENARSFLVFTGISLA